MSESAAPASATLIFTYRLTEHDAVASIGDGTHTLHLDAWHVTDALGDLLRCVVQLLQGYESAWCVWEDDPGEHKWLLRRRHADDADAVEIRILRFPTSFSGYGAPEEWAATVFEATCPLLKFAIKVRNTVRQLASGVDADQYRLRWGARVPPAVLRHPAASHPAAPRSRAHERGGAVRRGIPSVTQSVSTRITRRLFTHIPGHILAFEQRWEVAY